MYNVLLGFFWGELHSFRSCFSEDDFLLHWRKGLKKPKCSSFFFLQYIFCWVLCSSWAHAMCVLKMVMVSIEGSAWRKQNVALSSSCNICSVGFFSCSSWAHAEDVCWRWRCSPLKEGLEECKLLFLSSEANYYNSFFLLLKKSLQFFFKNLSLSQRVKLMPNIFIQGGLRASKHIQEGCCELEAQKFWSFWWGTFMSIIFLRNFFVVGIYSSCFQTAQHFQQKSVVAPSVSNSLPRVVLLLGKNETGFKSQDSEFWNMGIDLLGRCTNADWVIIHIHSFGV